MTCPACGAGNANNAPACGACGARLPARRIAPERPPFGGILALRASATLVAVVAVALAVFAFRVMGDALDAPLGLLWLSLATTFFLVPAAILGILALGVWARRSWAVYLTRVVAVLVAVAGFAIAVQGSLDVGGPVLLGALAAGGLLMLPPARRAHG